ncbi:MAG: amidohydrolase family protein [Acidobacteria bacterium]|nr:amidohydrolase family protein [Acidobacteriota bacterium]
MTGSRIFIALVACSVVGCAAPPEPADMILTNGRIYTLDWDDPDLEGVPAPNAPFSDSWQPDAEAIAVSGGMVVAAGTSDEIERWRDDSTEVVDLQGATAIPGLVESHSHAAGLGRNLRRLDLRGVIGEEDAVELIVAKAAETPPGEWILGWGFDEGEWATHGYPDNDLLSRQVPDHPVVLSGLHGFATWANQRALDEAGIDADTPTPSGGTVSRDSAGNPTGIFLNRASGMLGAAIPDAGAAQLEEDLRLGLEELARSGYVRVHEAGVGSSLLAAMESLDARGALPTRVFAMLSARDEPLSRRFIESGPVAEAAGSRLAVQSVKAYYDAALGSRGARMIEDYSDMPGHRGTSGNDYGFDQALVAELMAAGFQVGIHAIGDAGNRETLDFIAGVYEEAEGTEARRHRIEHAQVIHPDDLTRLAELGITASMQPPHAVEDKTWAEERVGPDRIRGAYAWRSLRRAGTSVIFSSDLAGSDHSIFYGLHAAVTRRDKQAEPMAGWYP